MAGPDERRYSISEAAEAAGVAEHLLRQWERKIPQLKPKRDRANRRYYTAADLAIARRVQYLVRHEKVTLDGARVRLAQELHGEGRPKSNREAADLVDKIQEEVRAMLDLLDTV